MGGNKIGDRNDAPTGDFFESVAQLLHVGNSRFRELQHICRRDEFLARAVAQNRLRSFEQSIPTIVLLRGIRSPILIYREVRIPQGISVAIGLISDLAHDHSSSMP